MLTSHIHKKATKKKTERGKKKERHPPTPPPSTDTHTHTPRPWSSNWKASIIWVLASWHTWNDQ